MNTEIELKFEIDSTFDTSSLGFGKREHQLTVMYDKDGYLEDYDARLRLRKTGDRAKLSYKKPLTRFGIKREIEIEVDVGSFSEAEALLMVLGYQPVSSYEKYRSVAVRDGVELMLDEYPFATYLEIEGKEVKIKKVAKDLGLKGNITKSCDTLFREWRIKNNLKPTPHMRFDDYDK